MENLVRRLAALYNQDSITEELIDAELSVNTPLSIEGSESGDVDLSESVEIYLHKYFASFGEGLPPPGLYNQILKKMEYPLITVALAATRGNQIKAAELLGLNRNTLRKKIRDLDIQVIRNSG